MRRSLSVLPLLVLVAIPSFAASVATPKLSVGSASYVGSVKVKITCATSGAKIRYTTDGSTPKSSSPAYSDALTFTAKNSQLSVTLKARAFKSKLTDSAVVSAKYVVVPQVSTPTFGKVAPRYTGSVVVAIATATSNARIKYTLDGSDPSSKGIAYSKPFTLARSTTVRARAYRSDWVDSKMESATFVIVVPTPKFTTAAGFFIKEVRTRPKSSLDDVVLRYTTDGIDPTSKSSRYLGLLDLKFDTKTTLKVRGFKEGLTESDVATATYSPAVLLLLHGMNSGPATWDELEDDVLDSSSACVGITATTKTVKAANCYTYAFMQRTVNGYTWGSGDGGTFRELGDELRVAMDKIATTQPGAVILVGHSRGGLAARDYLQRAKTSYPFSHALVTIGSPHQGSPLGRIKLWLDEKKFGPSSIKVGELRFLASPTVGHLATTDPPGQKDGAPLAQLNADAKVLGNRAAAFGEIVSTGLRLGENVYKGFNALDGTSVALALPGDFTALKAYVVLNLSGDWLDDGDGLVPTQSQRLSALPGFTRSSDVVKTTISNRVAHTSETDQTAKIQSTLEKVAAKLPAPAAGSSSTISPQAESELASQLSAAAARADYLTPDALVKEIGEAIRIADDPRLAAAENALIDLAQSHDEVVVTAVRERFRMAGENEQNVLVHLLGRIATPAAAADLIEAAESGSSEFIAFSARDTLARIGEYAPAGQRETIARLLIRRTDASPSPLRSAQLRGLASLGTADAVDYLLDTLMMRDEHSAEAREIATGLLTIRNAEAIPSLRAVLEADAELTGPLSVAAGRALAHLGSVDATRALLEWSASTGGVRAREHAAEWLSMARDPKSLEAIRAFPHHR